ncbi:MAG TPA: class I SAM-dependent methyltransferase [Candidatus Limnocylindrales bacterium]|nr:class I SAM-dependent methyltransferase [Candidatus Limnocylindrales bacterium]
MPDVDLAAVRDGFSRKADPYDRRIATDPADAWARGLVRAEVVRRVRRGARILELNAGTGADAAWLADRGYAVHATDVAPGMVERIAARAAERPGRMTAEERSFSDLAGLAGAPFDLVVSNFGGLNCTNRLEVVGREVAGVLRPGGHAVLVVMPPVSPWEHALVVRGDWRTSIRRWRRGGVLANIEGVPVRTWYHRPGRVAAAFGPGFRLVGVRSIGCFAPPLLFERFPSRHPRLTAAGRWLDERLGRVPPFNRMGDFCIVTLRRVIRDPGEAAHTAAGTG